MKISHITILCTAILMTAISANPADEKPKATLTKKEIAEGLAKHAQGAQKLSIEQDELSADVQDLIDEQTDPEIINLLSQLENVMADATDLLEQKKTDADTIATQTEVIEKIFEAAKKKQKKQGGG